MKNHEVYTYAQNNDGEIFPELLNAYAAADELALTDFVQAEEDPEKTKHRLSIQRAFLDTMSRIEDQLEGTDDELWVSVGSGPDRALICRQAVVQHTQEPTSSGLSNDHVWLVRYPAITRRGFQEFRFRFWDIEHHIREEKVGYTFDEVQDLIQRMESGLSVPKPRRIEGAAYFPIFVNLHAFHFVLWEKASRLQNSRYVQTKFEGNRFDFSTTDDYSHPLHISQRANLLNPIEAKEMLTAISLKRQGIDQKTIVQDEEIQSRDLLAALAAGAPREEKKKRRFLFR